MVNVRRAKVATRAKELDVWRHYLILVESHAQNLWESFFLSQGLHPLILKVF